MLTSWLPSRRLIIEIDRGAAKKVSFKYCTRIIAGLPAFKKVVTIVSEQCIIQCSTMLLHALCDRYAYTDEWAPAR